MGADVPAARATLRVLALLAEHIGPVRASTIARELGVPRSSVYHLLTVMRDEGFLIHYPELQAWGPSARVHEIGSSVLAATRLDRLAQPILDVLVDDAGLPATAHLAVLAGADVAYAGRGAGQRSPATVSRVGVRLPAARTATGRALLAALSDEQVRAILPSEAALRDTGLTSRRSLGTLLRTVRERGWATEHGDIDTAYGSVAASATDATGYPAAAVGLTFRLDAVDGNWNALGTRIRAAADVLSARLSGRARVSAARG